MINISQVSIDALGFAASAFTAYIVARLLASRETPQSKQGTLHILIAGLAVLGSAAGYTGGMSRVGVVGDIIPAALIFAGGVSAYLFGVNRSKGVFASVGALAFGIALLISYSLGTGNRVVPARYDSAKTMCFQAISSGNATKNPENMCSFLAITGNLCVNMFAEQFFDIYVSPTYEHDEKLRREEKYLTIQKRLLIVHDYEVRHCGVKSIPIDDMSDEN